jgi:ABC-type transport system substrate-binding protein
MKTVKWKLVIIICILSLFVIVQAACVPQSEPATKAVTEAVTETVTEMVTETEPVTLRIGTTSIWDAINPATGWESYNLRYLFYDGLIEWTGLTSFEPGLAESWTVSDDGLVWTFKIRKGLTFHDLTPCTAEDIAWSMNFLMEGMIPPLELYTEGFKEVVALDDTTLQITVSEPTALMTTARLHYAWVQALQSGEVDLINEVPYTAVEPLEMADNIEVVIMDSISLDDLVINSNANGTQPESLNDPAVRLAMDYAIDKQEIIDVGYAGIGDVAGSILPPSFGDWVSPNIQPLPHDLAKANSILDDAGYTDSDGDGIREDADGNPLVYRLYSEELGTSARILEIISNNLADIGISSAPTLMDGDSLYDLLEPEWDFDMQ